jgi:hypothetical protein
MSGKSLWNRKAVVGRKMVVEYLAIQQLKGGNASQQVLYNT